MKRLRSTDDDGFNQDSFLDVVANIVGILIILVLVAGIRAGKATANIEPLPDETEPVKAALKNTFTAARAVHSEVYQLERQRKRLARETANREAEQLRVATMLAASKQVMATAREKLDEKTRRQFDAQRAAAVAAEELEKVRAQTAAANKEETPPVIVENLPTPITKSVDGNEKHFRIKEGRIAYVPIMELLEDVKLELRNRAGQLRTRRSVSGRVGPQDGFYLHYTFTRVDPKNAEELNLGTSSSIVQMASFRMIPVNEDLGESLKEVLQPGSDFRRRLAALDRRTETMTLWAYPDSFDEYRKLKTELFRAGVGSAGRPMPFGVHIGGSPSGTKSASQ